MAPMPTLFFGHGSPWDALHETPFSQAWIDLAARFPRPRAIVSISAHWESKGVLITRAPRQRTIHDFYRFPQAFYDVDYPAPGDPELAFELEARLEAYGARADLDSWGLDHGTWLVLRRMYPEADVPVIQLSLDIRRTPGTHYEIAGRLGYLRDQGVLVMGTGNIVHNLKIPGAFSGGSFPWADRFDREVVARVEARDHEALVDFPGLGEDAALAVPESEHYLPLLYVLANRRADDALEVFNQAMVGTISMTGFAFGLPDPR